MGVDKFGKSNETLFAISPHGFYTFIYRSYPTIIICNSYDIDSGNYKANVIEYSIFLDGSQKYWLRKEIR